MYLFVVVSLLWLSHNIYAQNVDRYIIELSNNPLQVNEAVDMTIKAVDKNGDTVTSYVWDALLEVQWLTDNDVTYPNNGIVSFVASDQWEKKFNKWFIIKKQWDYKLIVRDILEDYEGSLNLTINAWWSTSTISDVVITSPIESSIESNQNINIVWSAKDYPNSPFKLFVDGKESTPSNTNENGDFSLYTDTLSNWEHNIQIKIFNSSDKIVAESEIVTFQIEQSSWPSFKSISISPSTGIKENDRIDVVVNTNDETRVVELIIWTNSFFMEKAEDGEFTKSLKISKNDTYDVDLKLSSDNGVKTFTKVDSITILPASSVSGSMDVDLDNSFLIKNLKYTYSQDTKKYNLTWNYEWGMTKFMVLIWKQKDNLATSATIKELVSTNSFSFTPVETDSYFVQVYGVNWSDAIAWTPSDIVYLSAPVEYKNSSSVCIVDSIKLDTTKVWDKHYLIWDKVSWVDRYIIYNADYPTENIASMNKIWETSQNRFEFYYDANAKTPVYKYYIVQGICNDGRLTNVASSEKVEVWPVNMAIYAICISLFGYLAIKLRKDTDY